MSLTLTCPFCNCDTPTEYNFCINYNQQIKCFSSSCGKKLVPGKPFCFGCGQTLTKPPTKQTEGNKYIRLVTL